MIRLNIGCGRDIKEGYINIDSHLNNGADMRHKLPYPLPFKDKSIDEIYCSHVLEDFAVQYIPIMNNFHRVLKDNGILHIKVPYGLSVGNPHHIRFFDETSFNNFIHQDDYSDISRFSEIILLKINRISIFDRFITKAAPGYIESPPSQGQTKNESPSLFYRIIKLLYGLTRLKKCEVEIIMRK